MVVCRPQMRAIKIKDSPLLYEQILFYNPALLEVAIILVVPNLS